MRNPDRTNLFTLESILDEPIERLPANEFFRIMALVANWKNVGLSYTKFVVMLEKYPMKRTRLWRDWFYKAYKSECERKHQNEMLLN
jgi:hypothetical protein